MFVDISAIRKSNALLKKCFAYFQAAISYEYISENFVQFEVITRLVWPLFCLRVGSCGAGVKT